MEMNMNKPRKYGSTCFLTFLRKPKERTNE